MYLLRMLENLIVVQGYIMLARLVFFLGIVQAPAVEIPLEMTKDAVLVVQSIVSLSLFLAHLYRRYIAPG